ncbi:probable glycosyltransferase At5g03795 isoform X2 [Impatiens glandulifera]|uniref:probable glycosyltransferase At5g03795 isoform X2 n=1 Tax=Impatiens glandulifera TaxID=253017 RepID=UPI001FB18763|nr:probable glycosyltransferase At5g03795 isoform X2 [Impatiens glandulifera]
MSLHDVDTRNKSQNLSSIAKMNALLLLSHSSPSSKAPQWSSKADQELLYAKKEIENAHMEKKKDELPSPLYRNVSMFKRSYELMEKMLRVYIYKEGEKPIFHESILEGIYASEGWFLKLLEANKHFVTDDPKSAHLFYLPFSSRLLQQTLYVPKSHSRENLIEYMKNYVDGLAAIHPFWNRTDGADHFLAACHDWAPAETRGKIANCIRALCNADISAGFQIGKDISLPTTHIRNAKDPLKETKGMIDGHNSSSRPILAFFAGYMHGKLRPTLVKYWGNKEKDPEMRISERLPSTKGDKKYIEMLRSSRFCICAKGFAVHSPRVVESILHECIPVMISDDYVPPFFEVLDWETFAVFVMEKDVPDLKKILVSISVESSNPKCERWEMRK